MRFPFVVVLLAALGFNTAQAEIYKCTVEGRISFSQHPCSADAVVVKPAISPQPTDEEIAMQEAANQSVRVAAMTRRKLDKVTHLRKRLSSLDGRIATLNKERSARLDNLQQHEALAEIDAVNLQYSVDLQRLMEERADVRSRLEGMLSAPR
jgi:TolA-binding protein